jgi:hypothetical protein
MRGNRHASRRHVAGHETWAKMKEVQNEAARLALLYDLGIIASDVVIRWADDLIVGSPKPSQELIELSVSRADDPASVSGALRSVAAGADVWSPVEAALPEILDFISAHPDRAPLAAKAFYHIAVEQKYVVPDSLRFFLRSEDDFDLADSGVYPLLDVYQRFVGDLRAAISAHETD